MEGEAGGTGDGLSGRNGGGEKEEEDGEEEAKGAGVEGDGEDEDEDEEKKDEKIEIEGVIDAVGLDGDGNVTSITVDGQTVAIGPETDVRGTIEVGARTSISTRF